MTSCKLELSWIANKLPKDLRPLQEKTRALTAHIAAFHDRAETRRDRGGAAVMAELAATNIGVLRGCRPAGFAAAAIEQVETGQGIVRGIPSFTR